MGHPPNDGYQPAHGALAEARLLVRLAVPVGVAQVGSLAMGLIDTWMVGGIGSIELAAVALGDACFFTLQVLAMGVVMALNPLIAQAYGAGDAERCAAAWRAGVRVSLAMSLPLALLVLLGLGPLLGGVGHLDELVVRATQDYLAPRALGILPQLLFVANRTLLDGMGDTRPAMIVTVLAVALNALLDWALIFGHLGLPALGVAGSGLATAICRWFMWAGMAWWLRRPRYRPFISGRGVPPGLVARVLRLGLPIGLSHSAEVGAFATGSLFMGWLGVTALASHQVALKMAATSFMVAVSLGIAASVRVGNALGAGRPREAQRSAWVALALGLLCMGCSGVVFILAGRPIVAAFSADPAVVELGAALLVVAAAFQLSDGTQAVCAGVLRGAGDTTRPLVAQVVGHWVIALPLGYVLAFPLGLGPCSVWWALALGLTVAAVQLLWWTRDVHRQRALD